MNSIILKNITRVLVFMINILAFDLIIKGHNAPGGGFIAGLVTSISLILMILTLNIKDVQRIVRYDPIIFVVGGLILAYGTSLLPYILQALDLGGGSFLKHTTYHLFPFLGESLAVHTPLFFDLGVYLVVVGVTTKLIMTFYYLVYEKKDYFLKATLNYSARTDHSLNESLSESEES